ncbi:VOC family protein [Shimia biformata]|uniref:VOC family protein n=1 Tax=Shimia biformata TaxID=1294299 RepID=UPI0019520C11|nr:VOC family protein [Shimia biformata]
MIGYTTVGTNDFERALLFYDGLFAEMDVPRLWLHGDMAAWGKSHSELSFCITRPFDKKSAAPGNGTMIALRMPDRETVIRVHAKAIELGGTCEGAPGPRGEHGFFAGYFRDLDGNKLNAYVPG